MWDKEKVCMAEMGYVPDEAVGVSTSNLMKSFQIKQTVLEQS